MVRYFYPAIVRRLDTEEYMATLPNFSEIRETKETLGELIDSLKKDIGDFLVGKNVAEYRPVEPATLQVSPPTFLMMIEYDELAYNKKYLSKAVTKTVSIPFWMNELVKFYKLPLSSLLQDAIAQRLGIEYKPQLPR